MITSPAMCMHDKSWLGWRAYRARNCRSTGLSMVLRFGPFHRCRSIQCGQSLLLGEQAPLLLCTSSLFPFVRALIRFVDREERERLGKLLGPVSPRFCRRFPRIKLNRRYLERKFSSSGIQTYRVH